MIELEKFQKLVLNALAYLIASQTRVLNKAKFHADSSEEAENIEKELQQLDGRYDQLYTMLKSLEK